MQLVRPLIHAHWFAWREEGFPGEVRKVRAEGSELHVVGMLLQHIGGKLGNLWVVSFEKATFGWLSNQH